MKKKLILLISLGILVISGALVGIFWDPIIDWLPIDQSGWDVLENGGQCYLDEDGDPITGWQELDSNIYYFDPDSFAMQIRWLELEDGRYYLGDDQKFFHALQLQTGAETAGEQFALCNQSPEIALRNRAAFQIVLQQCLVTHGCRLSDPVKIHAEIHAGGTELLLQLCQQLLFFQSRQIHFVDEQECGNIIPLQQPPKRQRMGLNTVSTADDKHRTVQNRQCAFRLRREVHMSRRIHQRDPVIICLQLGLFGKNGDAQGTL